MNTLYLLSLSVLSGFADPPQRAVEAVFPADSFAVVRFAGLDACKLAAEHVGWRALLDRSAERFGGAPLVELADRAMPEVDQRLAQLGVDRATLRTLLSGPIAFGLGRPTILDDEPVPSVGFAFRAEGDAKAAAQRVFDAIVRAAADGSRDVESTTRELAGVPCRIVTDAHGRRPNVVVGFVGDVAVVTNSTGYFSAIVHTAQHGADAFVSAPDVVQARSVTSGSELLWGHLRLGTFSRLLQDVMPYEVEDIAAAIGVRGIEGLGFDCGVDAFGSADALRVHGTGMESGVLGGLLPGGMAVRAARYLPLETLLLASHVHDGAKIVDAVARLVDVLPEEPRQQLQQRELHRFDRDLNRIGLDFETFVAMVRSLGPEVTFAVGTPSLKEGLIPTAMAFVETHGDAQLAQRLTNALVAAGADPKTQQFEGLEITYVSVPSDEIRLAPAFVEHDGMLIASSDLRALKRALRRVEKDGERLADDPDFVAMTARHADASMLWCLRLRHNLGGIYEALSPQLENLLAQRSDLDLKVEDLPSADELYEALGDVVLAVSGGQSGLTLRSESPLGDGSLLAVAGSLLDELLAGDRRRRVN